MWDVFISHASENKDNLVRPLAKLLSEQYKVKVWYDEFTLEYGDSLIESIEKGLQNSQFGVVIFSKEFFKKVWTKHEIKGLRTKEMMLNRKVIIPIWYNITKEEICNYSLTLADNIAIVLDEKNFDIDDVAVNIIKIIRPDIYKNINRMCTFEKLRKFYNKGCMEINDFKYIPIPPIRHEKLSKTMEARLKLIYNAISEVDSRSYEEYETDFRRNTNIDREIIITELITAAYIDCINKKQLTDTEKLYVYIITVLLGDINFTDIPLNKNDVKEYVRITKDYINDIDAYATMEFRFKDK